jgi:hypothetical protein
MTPCASRCHIAISALPTFRKWRRTRSLDRTATNPNYTGELFVFAYLTCRVWEKLSFAARVVLIELEVQSRAYHRSADAFWSQWTGAPLPDDTD